MFLNFFGADIECTGLLRDLAEQGENARLHVLGFKKINGDAILKGVNYESEVLHYTQKEKIQAFFNTAPVLCIHNGLTFDEPALQLLGYDTSKVTIIDTLYLSWYLFPYRVKHGLEGWGEELGFAKPHVDDGDWRRTDLPLNYFDERVKGDCNIQVRLWHHIEAKLKEIYGNKPSMKLIRHLMWKGKQQQIQQAYKWKMNMEDAETLQGKLDEAAAIKKVILAEAMPKVKNSVMKSRPTKCFLSNGKLSVVGKAWSLLTMEHDLPFDYPNEIEVIKGYEKGNPASHVQIKDWLYSLGWQPLTHKSVFDVDAEGRRTERQVPQVQDKNKDDGAGGLCDSVLELAEQDGGILALDGFGRVLHRQSLVKGLINSAHNGEVVARCGGFTNTLRLKHKELVNLPSGRVEWGLDIRGILEARKGKVLLGSDLSSLEDRLKHHFQIPLDPEYVKSQMTKGFDPHIAIALMAGLLSKADVELFKGLKALEKEYEKTNEKLTESQQKDFDRINLIRASGKTTNYACQYGAGVATIARAAKVDYMTAEKLHAGYWELNWSIKAIASSTTVIDTSTGKWQWNPISEMYYSLRSDKDRFSTLIQGSGAFVLDIWLFQVQKLCREAGVPFRLLGQFHDELILEIDEGMELQYQEIVTGALSNVNGILKLNRDLDCEVKFGKTYAEIH